MAGCGPVNGRYVAVGGGAQHGAYVFGCEARVLEFVFDLDLIEEAVVPQLKILHGVPACCIWTSRRSTWLKGKTP